MSGMINTRTMWSDVSPCRLRGKTNLLGKDLCFVISVNKQQAVRVVPESVFVVSSRCSGQARSVNRSFHWIGEAAKDKHRDHRPMNWCSKTFLPPSRT